MRRILASALLTFAAPALAQTPPETAAAVKAFSAAFADACDGAFLEDGALIHEPQRFDVLAPSDWGEPAPVVVWQFWCGAGAYNIQHLFLIHTDYRGIHPAALPAPELRIVNEDPEDFESAVKSVDIIGWTASVLAINAEFDPERLEIRETGYWRGIGDASNTAVWRLVNEGFRLVRYDVDASYDGEINPVTLVSYE